MTSRSKQCRRLGVDLEKFAVKSANTKSRGRLNIPPGQHGSKGRHLSDYGKQLSQKQMIKLKYGILEKQFKRYYALACKLSGSKAENLLHILERRLDNVIFRMGFASTRAEARQLVTHAGVQVNGKKVNIPSYLLEPGDVISIREKARSQLRIKAALELAQQRGKCEWIEVDEKKMEGTFKRLPGLVDFPDYNLNLIIELYSK